MTDSDPVIYQPSEWGKRYHRTRADEIFGAGAAGPGKALSLDTIIPTPDGAVLFEDIHPGMYVYGDTGQPVQVLAETEVMHGRPCYEIQVGCERIIADEQHEWVMKDESVKTTYDLHMKYTMSHILASRPVEYGREDELPVDPYLYGFMMFCSTYNDSACMNGHQIAALIKLKEYQGVNPKAEYHKVAGNKFRIKDKETADLLNSLIPYDNIRIDKRFLLSNRRNRILLLNGIIDSSGRKELPYLHPTDPLLSELIYLCGSVGIICNLKKRRREVKFNRKLTISTAGWINRLKLGELDYKRTHNVVRNVEETGSVPVKCIQVEGGIFLVTNSHIPTHNSMVLLHDPLQQILIEHLRCLKNPDAIPEAWETEAPGLKELVLGNPLQWGNSTAWVLQMMREMPNHEENIERAKRAFPTIDPDVDWNEKKGTFTFKSGLKYQFGSCKDRQDHTKYLSKQYTWVGFDELTRFNKVQYDFIRSRVRSADPVLRYFLRTCAMSNPQLAGGKGNDITVDDPLWVKKYFVDPWPDGNRLLVKSDTRRDGTVSKTSRIYLPATLYDNPDKEFVRQYESKLLSMPKHIRDCYLYGKWDGIVGSHFADDWNPSIHICEPFKIPNDWPIFRAQDWGFSTSGNVGYYALSPDNKLYKWFEITFIKKTASYVARELIRPFETKNKLWSGSGSKLNDMPGPSDRQIWEERGSSAKNKYQEMFDEGVDWSKADQRSREDNCATFKERLLAHNGMTETPGIVFFRNCKKSIETIPSLETDPYNLEQTKKAKNDHWYDETTYACRFALQADLSVADRKRDDYDDFEEPTERYY